MIYCHYHTYIIYLYVKGQYVWNWFQIYSRYIVTVSEAKLRYTAFACYLVRIQHLALLYTTNHNIQGTIWLLGLSRHNLCTIITILMSLSTQLLHRQARKSHARVWTLTYRLCTRTFRVCTPTLLKSVRFAAQRGSEPLSLNVDIIPLWVTPRVTDLFYTWHCCNADEVMSEPWVYFRVIITSKTLNLCIYMDGTLKLMEADRHGIRCNAVGKEAVVSPLASDNGSEPRAVYLNFASLTVTIYLEYIWNQFHKYCPQYEMFRQ